MQVRFCRFYHPMRSQGYQRANAYAQDTAVQDTELEIAV
jgi:hypothetical protein